MMCLDTPPSANAALAEGCVLDTDCSFSAMLCASMMLERAAEPEIESNPYMATCEAVHKIG